VHPDTRSMYTRFIRGNRLSIAMSDWISRHRITVGEYYRMAEEGILPPDARVELIEGVIIDMAPVGTRHAAVVSRLSRLLMQSAGHLADVRVQQVVGLSDTSEPQPDISLVKLRPDFYGKRHPRPEDTLLIIEVSDSSLRYDIDVKAPLYAHHEVPEYWVMDLDARQVRLFRSPESGRYANVWSTAEPGIISPTALMDIQIDLSQIFDE
jgi:Uma2 family endonuclease